MPKDNQQKTEKTEKAVIYQVMTRLFGNTNTTNKVWGTRDENGVGKFSDFNDKALKGIKELGFTHIWYTGVLEHAVLTDYTANGIPLDDADVVKGRAGSPYAIKDYYDVNPDLADNVDERISEFESLIERSHNQGLKVIMDFVPNHVARSYHSDAKPAGVIDLGEDDDPSLPFHTDNNFYYLPGTSFKVPEGYNSLGEHSFPTKDGKFNEIPAKVTGNNVFSASPSVNDWFETVKLNYGVDYQNGNSKKFDPVPDTWVKMTDILIYWAGKNVDGFRCDMAEMVPVEFWDYAIAKVKKQYPDIIFVAEIYNPAAYRDYITGGFDFLYDKVELYDTLKHIIQNKANTDHISQIWQRQEGIAANMLTFLENHDEQRIPSPDFAGDPWKAVPAMVLSATMNKGPVMVYFGQEVGEPGEGSEGFSGKDGRTTIFDYWGVPEHQKWVNDGKYDGGQLSDEQRKLRGFYKEILTLCNESDAVRSGDFFDLHYYNRSDQYKGFSDQVYAYIRHSENEKLLFVLNFGDDEAQCQIKIPQHAFDVMALSEEELIIEDF
ncbi:MAG: alpha-amylase family protein, partial [Cyclobacteriaceae bacterium]